MPMNVHFDSIKIANITTAAAAATSTIIIFNNNNMYTQKPLVMSYLM